MDSVPWNTIFGILTLRRNVNTYSFFCKLRKLIVSPNPVKASSVMLLMLLDRRSRWRNRWRCLRASLGIECMLLSPSLRLRRFSVKHRVHSRDFWWRDDMFSLQSSVLFNLNHASCMAKQTILIYCIHVWRNARIKTKYGWIWRW